MKRIIGILLCVTLVAWIPGFVGGLTPRSGREDGYALYFLVDDYENSAGGGALAVERVAVEGADSRETAEKLMEKLLEGPTEEGFKSAIPAGTALLSLELQGRRAIVDLSARYGTLSGIALTLADYAITLTLTQLTDIQAVEITVRGNDIAYRDQQIFTGRDVLIYPEEDVISTVMVELYFLGEDGALQGEKRELQLYEGDTQAGSVVAALADGPEDKDLKEIFPENFRVRSAWQEDEVCYVNLSSTVLEKAPDMDPADIEKALTAIGKSLCSLSSVTETRFLVDGEFIPRYGDVDISKPYN
ncbi:MAG: GerMN domain-containing protein [Oscillibacter sp.]|nr:GerMN domain-containing protein [Oscillibacter sp.]MBQ2996859.1 GerMN domain-containing protein [Oscillibacter sp.]